MQIDKLITATITITLNSDELAKQVAAAERKGMTLEAHIQDSINLGALVYGQNAAPPPLPATEPLPNDTNQFSTQQPQTILLGLDQIQKAYGGTSGGGAK